MECCIIALVHSLLICKYLYTAEYYMNIRDSNLYPMPIVLRLSDVVVQMFQSVSVTNIIVRFAVIRLSARLFSD